MTQTCAVCNARRRAGLRIVAAIGVELAGFAVARHFDSDLIASAGAATTIMIGWKPFRVLLRLSSTPCA